MRDDRVYLMNLKEKKVPVKDEGTVISRMQMDDIREQVNDEMLKYWRGEKGRKREESPRKELDLRKAIVIERPRKRANSSYGDKVLAGQKADEIVRLHR